MIRFFLRRDGGTLGEVSPSGFRFCLLSAGSEFSDGKSISFGVTARNAFDASIMCALVVCGTLDPLDASTTSALAVAGIGSSLGC